MLMSTALSKDGTGIAYDKIGNGTPLILVDGALCYRSFGPMSKLSSLLSKDFTVFIYDRRGRGDSTDKKPYSPDREVEDIDALIREAGGSASVFGISSGAALALRAAEIKLNIPKLALYEPPYIFDAAAGGTPPNHESRLKDFLIEGNRTGAVQYFMRDMVGVPSFAVFMMRLMPMWKRLAAIAHTLPYDAAIMGDFAVPAARIYSVKNPTLIAGGAKSAANLRTAVQSVADALPNKTVRFLEGQTHNVKPEVLAPVLTEFFKG